jgi:hypothetical protein
MAITSAAVEDDGIGAKVTMTWPVFLGRLRVWAQPFATCRRLKTALRHRPIAIDPEELTVRDHGFGVNIRALAG